MDLRMASTFTRFLFLLLATLPALGAVCSAEPSLPAKTAVVGSIKNPDTGKGVDGAKVWYDPVDLDDRVEQDRFYNFADGKGVFLAYLYPGRWRITCKVAGYREIVDEIRVRKDGHDPCNYMLEHLPRGLYTENQPSPGYAHFSGLVIDNDVRVGIPDVRVECELGTYTTDREGRFKIYDIPLHKQSLTLTHPAYETKTLSIGPMKEGQLAGKKFWLEVLPSEYDSLTSDPDDYVVLRGKVIDGLSRLPVNAQVSVVAPRLIFWPGYWQDGGSFEITGVPLGKRMILVETVREPPWHAMLPDTLFMLTVEPTDTLDIEIELHINSGHEIKPLPPGCIEGQVVNWYGGDPMVEYRVSLQSLYHWTRTDSAGQFRLDHVPEGDHVLHISDMMFFDMRREIVVHGIHVFSADTTRVKVNF